LPALEPGVPVEATALTTSKERLRKQNNEPVFQPLSTAQAEVSNLRVLVMDDQEMILELVKDVLTDGGHKADLVHDGEEAIAHYQKALEQGQPYDVVIMDLTIPGRMGGKETIVELQKLDPKIKTIVSSGYSNDPITSNYQEYGFKAVLPKPFDIDELLALVERLAKSS
jgi:CheY-like chemotaxis protein